MGIQEIFLWGFIFGRDFLKTAQNTFPDSLFALILYPRACLKMSNRKEKKNTEGRINNRNDCFKRAALHAWKLIFCHPFTDEIITLEAPLPDDFCRFLNANEEEKT